MKLHSFFHKHEKRKLIDIDETIEKAKDNFYWYNERFG
jgi:hypothetical protein